MGHQANFYATPADIAKLEAAISKLEAMVILHTRSPKAEPRILPSLRFTEDEQPLIFYHLVREQDLPGVVMERVPAQGYWTVDVLFSPVVEFNSCYFDGEILRRGRVYYVDGFYAPNEAWVEKPEAFRTWARGVLRATKKALTKHGSNYIGPGALDWLQHGHGKLVD